jgi:hypothetical protein
MKALLLVSLTVALVANARLIFASPAAQTNTSHRVGVYDSRVVAYAWFWSADHQRALRKQIESAKAAKSAGDVAQFNKLDRALSEQQRELHREVFSTAPAKEAVAALKDRLPDIQKKAGLSAIVSKWDDSSVKENASATQIDVTDLLVSEFRSNEKQLKTIQDLKKQKPIPLDRIDEMKDL